jgi:hypothetical protein
LSKRFLLEKVFSGDDPPFDVYNRYKAVPPRSTLGHLLVGWVTHVNDAGRRRGLLQQTKPLGVVVAKAISRVIVTRSEVVIKVAPLAKFPVRYAGEVEIRAVEQAANGFVPL